MKERKKVVIESCRNELYIGLEGQEKDQPQCDCGGYDQVVGYVGPDETDERAIQRVAEELEAGRACPEDIKAQIKSLSEDVFLYGVEEERLKELENAIKLYRKITE